MFLPIKFEILIEKSILNCNYQINNPQIIENIVIYIIKYINNDLLFWQITITTTNTST